MHESELSRPTEPDPESRSQWATAWEILPVRAFLLAFAATLLVWGVFLLPNVTLSPEAMAQGISPHCRAGTAQLTCQAEYGPNQMADPGAPAWQNAPADYFFRRARDRGEPRPQWNPYIGSGYPIALDGHNSQSSPTQWFLSHFPGDQSRDIVVFVRFLLWTFAIVWAVGLFGASTPLLAGVALAAVLAPYGAAYVDIAFLDADLLSPWFLLILLAFTTGRLSLWIASILSLALGVLIGAMAFPQANVVVCFAMGLLAFVAAPFTRGRSLVLAACLGAGVLAVVPSWLPFVRNMDQFISARSVQCVAWTGIPEEYFWQSLIHPPFTTCWCATATLVGVGLLPWVPRRLRFILVTLIVVGVWETLGLPRAACSLPLISGVRFGRHLLPHFQMLFIFAVGTAIQVLSERFDQRWPWVVFGAACAVSVVLAIGAEPGFMKARLVGCSVAGAFLGLLAAYLRSRSGVRPATWRSMFAVGLVLFAFPPYFFGSPMSLALLRGKAGRPEIAPLPREIDLSTPLGMLQKISQEEDRRHYSPSQFLFPNWPAAIGVLDMCSLYALYPVGYFELNGGLYQDWLSNEGSILKPDRFIGVRTPSLAMSTEFQRVMVANRVSLLTFDLGQSVFAPPPSPYEASKCRLLGRSEAQGAETYVCDEVGGVGYFPEVIRVVRNRADGVKILNSVSPSEMVKLALLGPELDSSIGTSGQVNLEPGLGRVVSVDRRGNDLTYVLDVEHGGIFVVADTYFRGWTAIVNSQPAGISRANVAFKAIRVPAGRVELKLHFSTVIF